MKYIAKPTEPDGKIFLANQSRMFIGGIYANNGPLNQEFEAALAERHGAPYLQTCGNGTAGLMLSVLSNLKKEDNREKKVITTPYTFAATSGAIWAAGRKPCHVDIVGTAEGFDLAALETFLKADRYSVHSVMSVPVYGRPYQVKEVYEMCKAHGIPLIMDGSHCFDVQYEGKYLWEYADVYVSSLHATKLMHCGEGGYIICKDETIHNEIMLRKNFGIAGEDVIQTKGINSKLPELSAALGLAVLPKVFSEIIARKVASEYLADELHSSVELHEWPAESLPNYQYFPIFLKDESTTLRVKEKLKELGFQARRYFYPSLDALYGYHCPLSQDLASRVLCLPIHSGIDPEDLQTIARTITQTV